MFAVGGEVAVLVRAHGIQFVHLVFSETAGAELIDAQPNPSTTKMTRLATVDHSKLPTRLKRSIFQLCRPCSVE
jgi:hypothetical protein